METRDLIYISVVADKYNNYIYPELRYHIENYLTQNYDKVQYYAYFNLNLEYLIKAIINHKEFLNGTEIINTNNIMKVIAPLIEREVFLRGI